MLMKFEQKKHKITWDKKLTTRYTSKNDMWFNNIIKWNLHTECVAEIWLWNWHLNLPSGKGNTCSTFGFPLNNPMTNDFDSVGYK